MRRARQSLGIGVLLIWGLLASVPAAGSVAPVFSDRACEEQIPDTVTVAVPLRIAERAGTVESLAAEVAKAFQTRAGGGESLAMRQLRGSLPETAKVEETDRCAGRRRLKIDLVLGSDYQVLDWLGQQTVDAGIVPWAGQYLLRRDEVSLLPVIERIEGEDAGLLWRQATRPMLAVRSRSRGAWSVEEDPQGLLDQYRAQLWCRALRREAGAPETPQELVAARERCGAGVEDSRTYRLVMPSHLSSGGFVVPLLSTGAWLEERRSKVSLAGLEGDARQRAETVVSAVVAAFWGEFFAAIRLSLDHQPWERLDGSRDGEAPLDFQVPAEAQRVEFLFFDAVDHPEGDEAVSGAVRLELPQSEPAEELAKPEKTERLLDRLVLRDRGGGVVSLGDSSSHRDGEKASSPSPPAGSSLPVALPKKFPLPPTGLKLEGSPRERRIARAYRPLLAWLDADPLFGARTFDFTADEALRLTRLHSSGRSDDELSLVLPGGGVKASYQSEVLDTLYGRRALVNRWAPEASAGCQRQESGPLSQRDPLVVDHVVGTSGGSLIGFFVARLNECGPFNLSKVLWQDAGGDPLTSAAIFGGADLLRWLSLVVVFLCLCALMMLRRRGLEKLACELSTEGSEDGPRQDEEAVEGFALHASFRPRLTFFLLPILLLAPVATRWLSGNQAREHVPVIEGLLYAVLVWLAMLADQCLVLRPPEDGAGPAAYRPESWISWRALVILGAALMLVPLYLRFRVSEEVGLGQAPFGLVYALTVILVGLLVSVAVHWRLQVAAAGTLDFPSLGRSVGEFALCALSVPLILLGIPPLRGLVRPLPILFTGLVLIAVFLGAYSYLFRGKARRYLRSASVPVAMVLGCAAVLLVTAPVKQVDNGPEKLREILMLPSGLEIFPGSIVFIVGSLILGLGLMLWVHAAHASYRLEGVDDFLVALFVVLLHGLVVYLVVFGLSRIPGLGLSLLELTGRFWWVLLGVAVVSGLILLWLVCRSSRNGWIDLLKRGVGYLNQRHPNGAILSWRALRLAFMAVIFLGWWNVVVAPALYGNQSALEFLQGSRCNFERAYCDLFPAASECREALGKLCPDDTSGAAGSSKSRFTALFITPANELEADGTRFFSFAPTQDSCPAVRQEPGSGGSWHSYWHTSEELLPWVGNDSLRGGVGCQALTSSGEHFLTHVIFASGSPFPIFPAHRVELPRGEDEMFLVDGGYSNNVPVEAARVLAADRVLILRSSNSLDHLKGSGRLAELLERVPPVAGLLLRNIGRLPGFLFERSQQTDRRSSRELFVVSIAPPREHADWPLLVDFRKPVVERLKCLARLDLGLPLEEACTKYGSSEGTKGAQRIALVESWGRPGDVVSTTEVSEYGLGLSRE